LFLGIGAIASMTLFVPWRIPENGLPYADLFSRSELKNGMPKNLLARVAYQESRFRPEIIDGSLNSSAGARGIMQIVPKWHPNVNPLDPKAAIPYAGDYLKGLYNKFGSWSEALAAYNWGQGNLSKWLAGGQKEMPDETKNYVSQIMSDIFKV